MEQFRHIGEVLGSLKALMVFQNDIQINQKQCGFLLDILTSVYEAIGDEMKSNLRFEERHTKWKVTEQPLRELCRVYREAEAYIRQCFESKDFWVKAIMLYQNRDCVELHTHNLLCCVFVVIEAIEAAAELSSGNEDEMQKRRLLWSRKYQNEWSDPKLFQWKFGKKYMVSPEFCSRIDSVWKEDRWVLMDKIREKRIPGSNRNNHQLMNLLLRNLNESDSLSDGKLLPCSILVGSKDYQVRRRLGTGGQYKEILWLGESFVLRHIKGDIEPLVPEISRLISLSHPNILQFLCGFVDEEKKECYLVTELMSKTLCTHMKESFGPRKRAPLPLSVVIDIMLQIARGMEYLHSKKIYHGDLNPSNILIKPRGNGTTEGNVHVKVAGFGLRSPSHKNQNQNVIANQNEAPSFIWHAPEILAQQEDLAGVPNSKHTEKSDVYSYAMICFELLTGKVPFEDAHLQGDKMSRNIKAGERPLFPFHCPKYVGNLTKRCWHFDPNQRPSFSSICRILRYVKRFLAMNLDHNQADQMPSIPQIDYSDIESGLLKKFPNWRTDHPLTMSEIPFQMFAYRVMEKEKSVISFKDTSESGSEGASVSGDEHVTAIDDPFLSASTEKKIIAVTYHEPINKRILLKKSASDIRVNKSTGTPKARSARPPQLIHGSHSMHIPPDSKMLLMSPRIRRKSGHASDSEIR